MSALGSCHSWSSPTSLTWTCGRITGHVWLARLSGICADAGLRICLHSSACLIGLGHPGRPQPPKDKPKTQSYIEDAHRCIEPPQVHDLVEVRENVENQSTPHAKCGRD